MAVVGVETRAGLVMSITNKDNLPSPEIPDINLPLPKGTDPQSLAEWEPQADKWLDYYIQVPKDTWIDHNRSYTDYAKAHNIKGIKLEDPLKTSKDEIKNNFKIYLSYGITADEWKEKLMQIAERHKKTQKAA